MSEYTIKTVAEILDIDRGRCADWISRGYLKPSVPSKRQGVAAKFTRLDIISGGLFKKLVERGFDREQAANHVSQLATGNHDIETIWWAIFGIIPDATEAKGYRVISWYHYHPLSRTAEPSERERVPQSGLPEPEGFDMLIFLNFKMVREEIDKRLKKK